MVKGDRSVDSMATARALFEDLQLEPFAELGPSGSGWRHRGAAAAQLRRRNHRTHVV